MVTESRRAQLKKRFRMLSAARALRALEQTIARLWSRLEVPERIHQLKSLWGNKMVKMMKRTYKSNDDGDVKMKKSTYKTPKWRKVSVRKTTKKK